MLASCGADGVVALSLAQNGRSLGQLEATPDGVGPPPVVLRMGRGRHVPAVELADQHNLANDSLRLEPAAVAHHHGMRIEPASMADHHEPASKEG